MGLAEHDGLKDFAGDMAQNSNPSTGKEKKNKRFCR
jgi:hypothetical protein